MLDVNMKMSRSLSSLPCWSATSGGGTGSRLGLEFGRKIKRKKEISNPKISEALRQSNGEFGLLVFCTWRISDGHKVIGGSYDDLAEGGETHSALQEIGRSSVLSITVDAVTCDLRIVFVEGLILDVFCNETNTLDETNNFYFFSPDDVLVIGPKSLVSTKAHSRD